MDPSGTTDIAAKNLLSDNIGYIHAMAYTLIGVGVFVFFVGFLGCCGAIKEWRPLLVTYAICLIIIMGIELGVGIAVGVNKDKVLDTLNTQLTDWTTGYSFVPTSVDKDGILVISKESPITNQTALLQTNAWNAMQVYFECCGAKDFRDFLKPPYMSTEAPVFCCKFEDKSTLKLADRACGAARTNDNSYQNTGCVTRITAFIKDNAPAVIGVSVGIGLIELVGIIFAFCLCCAVGDKGSRYN